MYTVPGGPLSQAARSLRVGGAGRLLHDQWAERTASADSVDHRHDARPVHAQVLGYRFGDGDDLDDVATSAEIPPAPCGGGAPPATYQHVVWIWMENHHADEVLDPSADTPFEQDLARRCGSATTYRAVGSPSLPNYVAATSGDTQAIHDDGSPAAHPVTADNLFRQVPAVGGTARSYQEAMIGTCALRSGGRYAVKHNPQAYFVGPGDRAACQRDDVAPGVAVVGSAARRRRRRPVADVRLRYP